MSEDTKTAPSPKPRKVSILTWLRWASGFFIFASFGLWMASETIATRIESVFIQRLAERGIFLRYTHRHWSLWGGLSLEDVAISRDREGRHPALSLSSISASFPWLEIAESRQFVSKWRITDGKLELRDTTGPLQFEHVSTQILVRATAVEIPRLAFQHEGWSADLTGQGLFTVDSNNEANQRNPPDLDLSFLRGILSVLNFQASDKPFAIKGTYVLIARGEAVDWHANLTGRGTSVSWQGVPFREASAKAELSSQGLQLTSGLKFPRGFAEISLTQRNWDESPLLLSGRLQDASSQADDFSASYDVAKQSLHIRTLTGPANLWEFAHNFPALVPNLKLDAQIQKFPLLAVRDLTWIIGQTFPVSGSCEFKSPANLSLTIAGEPLKIEALEGRGSFTQKERKFDFQTGPVSWRDWKARDSRIEATLAVTFKSTISAHLAAGSLKLDLARSERSDASWEFSGSLTDSHGQTDALAGRIDPDPLSLRLGHLEGRADLAEFLGNFPIGKLVLPNGVKMKGFPNIAVKDLNYRLGQPATFERLRIVSPAALTVDFRGRPLEIAGLTGAITSEGKSWRLSDVRGHALGGTFAVDGLYNDRTLSRADITLTQLRVDQLEASLGSAKTALRESSLTLEYHGSIGAEPAQLTGSGHVRLDNAPLVNVPLLDQTYALFSALSSVVKRPGSGNLLSNFSAQNGVAIIEQFVARSDAIKVTADGTIDLVQRRVSGHAYGNLRGLVGVVTSPLSHTLEMEVSGPLDEIRVRPVGLGGIVNRSLKGTAGVLPKAVKESSKFTGDLLQNGVALPLKSLDLFRTRPEK